MISSTSEDKGAHARGKDDPIKRRKKSLNDMYASDHKDREKVNSEQENNPPPSVEELYTAVKKKPSVPMNEPVLQAAEDLYTAVIKKPKSNKMEDEEEAPPIPPHAVEDNF